jgi:hypothetical protein
MAVMDGLLPPKLTFGSPEEAQVLSLPDGSRVAVQKRSIEFRLWSPACKCWNKPVLNLMDKQVCAETAVVRLLSDDGWEAVWVSSNGYRNDFPRRAPFCNLNAEAEAELRKVRGTKLTGCWDVFAFKKGRVLFIECKRKSGDSIRPSQRDWLFAALKVGFTLENFLILEWTADDAQPSSIA